MSASLVLSFSCLRSCLRSCLPSWLGCRVRLAGLSPSLSPIWPGMLCPPPWSCLSLVSGLVSQLLSLFCLVACLSSGMLCLPILGLFPKQFTVGVLNAVLSVSALAGVLCPPRWACLPICLPSGFVFHLGSGAVSASLGLSPNLSPISLCLSPWLGCCVRLAGLVSQFVSHLALSFTLAGVLCPPRWACLPICLPSGFVFQLGWGAVSASLPPSFVFHVGWVLCPPRWACLPICLPIWLCLSPWLGCCVRLAGLVSGLVSHLALSFTLAGVLCLPRWAGLLICLPIYIPPGFVFHLGWGAVSASLGLSPNPPNSLRLGFSMLS